MCYHSHSLMLSSSNYLQPLPDAFIFKLLTASKKELPIQPHRVEWGSLSGAPNGAYLITRAKSSKSTKKSKKSAKKLERKYDGTDDCIIDVRYLYPAPLLQIFSKKLKLKLQGTCLKESAPRDIEKGTQSKLIRSLYVQRMYKFWKWIKKSIWYDLGDYDMTYPKTCPSISCWQIRRWSKPPRWSNLLQLTSRYP